MCDIDNESKKLTQKDILNSVGKKKNLEKLAALANEDCNYLLCKRQ